MAREEARGLAALFGGGGLGEGERPRAVICGEGKGRAREAARQSFSTGHKRAHNAEASYLDGRTAQLLPFRQPVPGNAVRSA